MDKARNIQIMGIVNLTDDSYFAPSRCLGTDGMPDAGRTVGMVGKMLSEGADIIDIAGTQGHKGLVPGCRDFH